jgi:nucleoside-diphosphate-sugar epimerase
MNGSEDPRLASDLAEIFSRLGPALDELRGRRIFVTGGTGFIGSWILECLAWANRHLDLDVRAVVLTRDADAFRSARPHLGQNPSFTFHPGDVRSFDFPAGPFSHVLHCATTSAEATFRGEDPLTTFDILAVGTRRVLEMAERCGAGKVLFTSSGSAYGPQPTDLECLPETYGGAPSTMETGVALGEAKRVAEFLCATFARRCGSEVKILRGFSFVGPYLQLDIQYAIGNFIRDALQGRPIRIKGDGSQVRSYQYVTDLMVWFWTIFARGESCRPYNVGSERAVTIAELAHLVSGLVGPSVPVVLEGKPVAAGQRQRYVPTTERARRELGLREEIDLETAIVRTARYYSDDMRPVAARDTGRFQEA